MKLFSCSQYKKLIANHAMIGNEWEYQPVVKLVLPDTNCIWLLSEIDPACDLVYGLSDFGNGTVDKDWFRLSDLLNATKKLKHGIKQDKAFRGYYPHEVYVTAALEVGHITTDLNILSRVMFQNLNEYNLE